MIFLGVIVVIILIIILYKTGINTGAIVGAIIGLIIGSSLGIAGGGFAINGAFIFTALGFIVGALLGKSNPSVINSKVNSSTINESALTDFSYNLPPEIIDLINQEKEFEIAEMLVYLEMKGDGDIARKIMRIIRSENSYLGHRVKSIRDNLRVKNNLN